MRAALLLLPLLAGCATARAGPSADATRALLAADRAFAQASEQQGVEGWVSAFAAGGAMLSPRGPIVGHPAIREAMAPAFASPSFSLTWEPQVAEVSRGGRLGVTRGRFRRILAGPDGVTRVVTGTYVNLWLRAPGGEWKVVANAGDPDGPPAPLSPEEPPGGRARPAAPATPFN